jgi:hypothetical protein
MKVLGLNGRQYPVCLTDYALDWNRKVSKPQKRVKDFLRPYWVSHVLSEEFAIPGCGKRPLRVDLINWTRQIAVEVSPVSSHSFNQFFHKDRIRFSAAVHRDLKKEEWCKMIGFTYVELNEKDIDLMSPKWFEETYGITL